MTDQPNIDLNIEYPEKLEELTQPHRYKVAEGGRGGAKSHFFAEQIIKEVFCYGKWALCCREVQHSLKDSVKALIEKKIDKFGLRPWFMIKEAEILCPHNSGKISFSGLRQSGADHSAADNLKSYEGYDICWVEEAQMVSKMSLDLLLPTIRKPGSEVWFSYNRKIEHEPVHDRFVTGASIPPDTVHVYINWWDNPWFRDTPLYELMMSDKSNSEDDYNYIWCGLPQKISEATIIRKWCVRDFIVPADTIIPWKFGVDFGFFPDPCCLIRSYLDWNTKEIYIADCIFKIELDPDQIDTDLFALISGIKGYIVKAESARPELIKHLKNRHYRIEAVKKGAGSITMGLDWLKHWNIVVHPRCLDQGLPEENITDEFQLYKYKTDPATGKVVGEPIDKFNHAVDALRYTYNDEIMKEGAIDYVKMMGGVRGKQEKEAEAAKRSGGCNYLTVAGLPVPPVGQDTGSPVVKRSGGVSYADSSRINLKLPDGSVINTSIK